MPIVQPNELAGFEDFMYKYYEHGAIPPEVGIHNFGQGVFAFDPNNPNFLPQIIPMKR